MIRATIASDIPALQAVLDTTELFPSEMLPDMLAPFLAGGPDRWLTYEQDGKAVGFCFAREEELAEGTWNMLAIAAVPLRQGVGSALVGQLEADLRKLGARIVIADTSGTDDFTDTRAFYAKTGYNEEARIRDFWAKDDDKIVFRKAL